MEKTSTNLLDATSDFGLLRSRLQHCPPRDRLVTLQQEAGGLWDDVEDCPKEVSFEHLLTHFLDLGQVPAPPLLAALARAAGDKQERETLTSLAQEETVYHKWRLNEEKVGGPFLWTLI